MSTSLLSAALEAPAMLAAGALHGPPSVVLFAASARARDRVRARMPLSATVVGAATQALVVSAAPAVDCAVVAREPGEDHPRDLAPLARALVDQACIPVVVCGDVTARERVELLRAGVCAVMPPNAPAWALWGEVQCAVSAALLARTASRLGGGVRLGAALRAALTALCVEDPPPASVTAVCTAVGAHRRTLWYQWHQRIHGAHHPRFEDVVTAAVLVRALMRRSRGLTWSAIARACGVHRHTLARGASALLGLAALPPRVGERTDAAHAAARQAFAENVVRPALRKQML